MGVVGCRIQRYYHGGSVPSSVVGRRQCQCSTLLPLMSHCLRAESLQFHQNLSFL